MKCIGTLFLLFRVAAMAGAETLWIEGEAPCRSDVRQSGWVDELDATRLRGGKLLGNLKGAGNAWYTFSVQAAGPHVLWMRCGTAGGLSLSCQFDDGAWIPVDMGKKKDNGLCGPNSGLHYLGWVSVGPVALTAGEHTLAVRMDSKQDRAGLLDCLVVTDDTDAMPWRESPLAEGREAPLSKSREHEGIIWIEGEDATAVKMSPSPWWFDKVNRSGLSNGAWLSNFTADRPGMAAYGVESASGGVYRLWVHATPLTRQYALRMNGGEWNPLKALEVRDKQNIAADGKLDLRFIAWIDFGEVALAAGRNTLELRGEDPNSNHMGIDCLVLVPASVKGFAPDIRQRPWEDRPNEVTDAGHWRFEPAEDAFSPDAMLDLRRLNERWAGEHGFIRATSEGGFVRGDGHPIRFWGAGTSVMGSHPRELESHARFLAKRGVNMVRFHGMGPLRPDAAEKRAGARDKLWRLVAAMKREGIYTTYSAFYPHAEHPKDNNWGEDVNQDSLSCLLFFYEPVQALYKDMLRDFLTTPNPYTGIALRDDPALAIIQMQNEDGMLFWTAFGLKGRPREVLLDKFEAWGVAKYGSREALLEAWFPGEGEAASGKLRDFENPWLWTREAIVGKRREPSARVRDQLAFFVETMRAWNAEFVRFVRDDLKCRQMLNIGNWRTVDDVLLMDAERYSYQAGDVIAKNNYNPALHIGANAGWAIANGDLFDNPSRTLSPGLLPCNLKQTAGKPMIIPECLWAPPNECQAEGPLMTSAYMSLSGVDCLYWFEAHEPRWRDPSSANGFLPSLGKFRFETPGLLGNFPAAALLFREGYVAQGSPAVVERRTPAEVLSLVPPIVAEAKAHDPNVDATYDASTATGLAVDPLAFLVGPVLLDFVDAPTNSLVSPELASCIDHRAGRVRSNTGELCTDFGRGLFTVDAPKAKAACGYLSKAGAVDLSGVTIACSNAFASVVVVSLDDRPIAESEAILIQVGTRVRSLGWKDGEASWTPRSGGSLPVREVVSFGKAPWMIEDNAVAIVLDAPAIAKVVALDMNGMPLHGEIPVCRDGGKTAFALPAEGMYFIATK